MFYWWIILNITYILLITAHYTKIKRLFECSFFFFSQYSMLSSSLKNHNQEPQHQHLIWFHQENNQIVEKTRNWEMKIADLKLKHSHHSICFTSKLNLIHFPKLRLIQSNLNESTHYAFDYNSKRARNIIEPSFHFRILITLIGRICLTSQGW